MGTLRRLYIYVVSVVSLLAVAGGIGSLLETVLREVEDALTSSILLRGGTSREQLSLSIALIVVGGPVWLVHWWLARRGRQVEGAPGLEDRASGVRAWYLALVQAITLTVGIMALVSVLSTVVGRALGVADDNATWSAPLAAALVAWPVWALTERSRAAEIRTTPMTGAAAWVTRLYRYGALFATVAIVLLSAAGLIATLLSVLVGRPDFGLDDTWWRRDAVGGASAMLVGAVAWALHWRDAVGTIRDVRLIGEDDRQTRLRAAYFGFTLLAATAWCAVVVAGSLADLLRRTTGLTPGDATGFLEEVVGPPLAVLPVMVAGWWHTRYASREASDLGPANVADWGRNARLLVALVGLAFVAAGSAQLVELALTRLAVEGEASMSGVSAWSFEVPWYLAQMIVGAALWLPAWARTLRARERDAAAERASSATRAHLFLVVGIALVVGVPTGVMTLYNLLNTILGGEPMRPLLADLAFPIAVLVVATAIGAYHARILPGDLRAAVPESPRADVMPEGAMMPSTMPEPAPAASPRQAATPIALDLTVRMPPGSDADAWIALARSSLPPGATLAVNSAIDLDPLAPTLRARPHAPHPPAPLPPAATT